MTLLWHVTLVSLVRLQTTPSEEGCKHLRSFSFKIILRTIFALDFLQIINHITVKIELNLRITFIRSNWVVIFVKFRERNNERNYEKVDNQYKHGETIPSISEIRIWMDNFPGLRNKMYLKSMGIDVEVIFYIKKIIYLYSKWFPLFFLLSSQFRSLCERRIFNSLIFTLDAFRWTKFSHMSLIYSNHWLYSFKKCTRFK